MRILVGLSGGVDSAVALALLKAAGHQVTAAFMRNWDSALNNDFLGNPDAGAAICPQEADYLDALRVADLLDVELLRVDFIAAYYDEVFKTFLSEYQLGRTPNPDILCNKAIKFTHFLNYALANGFEAIATGHYAGKVEVDGRFYITKGVDSKKDQSYFLAQLTQHQLAHTLFPLATWTKQAVRQKAMELGIPLAGKKGSTGICFIGERNFRLFLSNYLPMQPGAIIDVITNTQVGTHHGSFYYTLGQRKGLGIGGIKGRSGSSWFVVSKDVRQNIVYVADAGHQHLLDVTEVTVEDINLFCLPWPGAKSCTAQFRYHQVDAPALITLSDNTIHCHLEAPVRAVTPGQQAVFYQGEKLIAAGVISGANYPWKA